MADIKFYLPLFIALPLSGAFLVSLLGKKFKVFSYAVTVGVCALMTFISLSVYFGEPMLGVVTYKMSGWPLPYGIVFVVDALGLLVLTMINTVAFIVALYSIPYVKRYTASWKYYTLYLLMVAGMNGVAATGDIFNLFVFLEIASIASYGLVAFGVEAEELEASFKYMVLGTLGSLLFLLAIGFIYALTGTLNLADISQKLPLIDAMPKNFIIILLIVGLGIKAALVPFHSWLPDAYSSAPAPISAMFSGVLIKTHGVYALVRILFNVFGLTQMTSGIFMFLGSASMLIGVLLALYQWDFKRLLAYHSISQIGYAILGIGLGTPLGVLGGLFHLVNHAIFKSLLFLNAGAVEYETGTRDLSKMGGLREQMPVTANTSLIASMSIAGIPPFNGFWSKLIIIMAAVQANQYLWATVAVISSILTLASFLKVQKYAFSGHSHGMFEKIKEVPFAMMAAMIIFAFLCLLTSLPVVRERLIIPAVNALLDGRYGEKVLAADKK
ncbi:MAG: Na(+)/H(+) antiporter subunit D [candidate division WS2 bacterium]|nr:Na(+)/H(+) antiporter subunit D [Candidatus Lithacetigena glycinireducens]